MTNGTPDPKIVEKVQALLARTTARGATEAEAQTAAAMAARLMEQHGLDTLTVERAGGQGEGRERTEERSSFGPWYGPLMRACAESCFCYCQVRETTEGKRKELRFELIGRGSSVASARVLYEYLRDTVWRLARESGVENRKWFRHGCSERVTERVRQRHEEELVRQRQEAEERAAAARHPAAAPGGTELVVTLVDWQASENDLNEDFRRGVAPGTTQAERERREARALEKKRRWEELEPLHGWDVAWWMIEMGHTLEEAIAAEAASQARGETEAARASTHPRKERGWTRADEAAHERRQRRQEKEAAKRSDPAFRAGRSAAESVSLSRQVGSGTRPAPASAQKIGGGS